MNRESRRQGLHGPSLLGLLLTALLLAERTFAVFQLPGEEIDSLVGQLSDPDPDTRKFALIALSIAGTGSEKAKSAVRAALLDDDPEVRAYAAMTLPVIDPKDPAVFQRLVEATSDDNNWARAGALVGLAEIGSRDAIEVIVRTIEKESLEFRSQIVDELRARYESNPVIVDTLVGFLGDEQLRITATELLGELGVEHERAAEALKQLLGTNSGDEHLHEAATQALAKLSAAAATGDARVNSALLLSGIQKQDIVSVRAAIASGADPNGRSDYGEPAFVEAALLGLNEIVQLLLQAGADVNISGTNGYTALIAATDSHDPTIVQQLLSAGARIDATAGNGETALLRASKHAPRETVQLLLKAGADINHSDSDGRTPLIFAAQEGRLEIVKTLAEAGADVNARDTTGSTALIHAVRSQFDVTVIEILLEAGADVNGANDHGATALDVAVILGKTEMETLLRRGGGRRGS